MTTLITPNAIPGMIEPVEQALLSRLAESTNFSGPRQAIEFGAFFGRSTTCLANGMALNATVSADCKLHVFDSFSCNRRDGFIRDVVSFAKAGGVDKLLRLEGQMVSFLPIFAHYLSDHIKRGLVVPQVKQLCDSRPPAGPISLMHIDSPKFYEEFKTILFRFFPQCEPGCSIIFQDYFYHWSAGLIAAVELLRQRALIELHQSAASSLSAKLVRTPSVQEIMEIDLEMQSKPRVTELLTSAADGARAICSDREDIFVPRVRLALIQHLFVIGETKLAADHFRSLLKGRHPIPALVFSDYLELLAQGFSIRTAYERDHAQAS